MSACNPSDEDIEDMDNLRHMLGIAWNIPKRRWGYRNYYASNSPSQAPLPRTKTRLRLRGLRR